MLIGAANEGQCAYCCSQRASREGLQTSGGSGETLGQTRSTCKLLPQRGRRTGHQQLLPLMTERICSSSAFITSPKSLLCAIASPATTLINTILKVVFFLELAHHLLCIYSFCPKNCLKDSVQTATFQNGLQETNTENISCREAGYPISMLA